MTFKGDKIVGKPTFAMVEIYIAEKGLFCDAKECFDYWEHKEWLTKKGEPVKTLEGAINAYNSIVAQKKNKQPTVGKYEVYTDGTYSWKNNEGAFAFVILKDCHEIVMQRAYKIKDESNNRAELKAIIAAIHNLPKDAKDVEVISDSQYALYTLSGRWGQGKNKDLFDVWRTVRNSHLGVHITWTWVKGHDGDYFNEMCDKLCCDVLGYDPAEEYAKFKKKKK